MKEDLRNLYIAVLLSAVAMFFVSRYFDKKEVVEQKPQEVIEQVVEVEKEPEKIIDTAELLAKDERVVIQNDVLSGSLRLKGSRIDNLSLTKYRQTLEEDSPYVELFTPSGSKNPYYMQFGWISADQSVKVPDENTVWQAKEDKISADSHATLEWDNGEGLHFINKIYLDEHYMFKIEQIVENNTDKKVEIAPYALITKNVAGLSSQTRVVHEGMIGVFNDKLEEVRYSSLDKEGEKKVFESKRTWAGFSDHYWFSALIYNNNNKNVSTMKNTAKDTYQVDYILPSYSVDAGSSAVNSFSMFAGAKEIKLLDEYVKNDNIAKFDLAVDFGWYYFLTKPFFYILDFLYHVIGNMGWAILLFAALLRLCMFPIANKSFESMSKMKKFQPKIQSLQERYKDDKVRLQQEMMTLYKKEKINPASGCLPILIQIPVFFSLYKVLNISIEIRHAPFIGWIKDLSAPDPLVLSELLHIYIPSFFNIGIWPILMGITMFIQQKLSPAPANKDQARMFVLMPIIFTFMMGHFASGLIIYWTLSNILGIIQQKAIMHKNGVK